VQLLIVYISRRMSAPKLNVSGVTREFSEIYIWRWSNGSH